MRHFHSRRRFLQLTLGGLGCGLAGLMPRARAGAGYSHQKFLFIWAQGGWDVTQAFAPLFNEKFVEMPDGTQANSFGGIDFVSHASRPAVDTFFERWAAQSVLINGITIPSVSHEDCAHLLITGSTSDVDPDWATRIAAKAIDERVLPHIVVAGRSYSGELASVTTRVGTSGRISNLLNGDVLEAFDQFDSRHADNVENLLDTYMRTRSAGNIASARGAAEQMYAEQFENALIQAQQMKDLEPMLDWTVDDEFSDQARFAVDVLSTGMSRCATINHMGDEGWDTHAENDTGQNSNFEDLFGGLTDLMSDLSARPGEVASSLAAETTVVVMSEMGRSPQTNEDNGRDHWPCTSMLLIGPGLDGGRVVGGFDSMFMGEKVDMASGEISSSGTQITPGAVGAALLSLAGVDPAEEMPEVIPLTGILT